MVWFQLCCVTKYLQLRPLSPWGSGEHVLRPNAEHIVLRFFLVNGKAFHVSDLGSLGREREREREREEEMDDHIFHTKAVQTCASNVVEIHKLFHHKSYHGDDQKDKIALFLYFVWLTTCAKGPGSPPHGTTLIVSWPDHSKSY